MADLSPMGHLEPKILEQDMISTLLLNPLISQMGHLGGTGPRTSYRPGQARSRLFLFRLVHNAAPRPDPHNKNLRQELRLETLREKWTPSLGSSKGATIREGLWVWGVGA